MATPSDDVLAVGGVMMDRAGCLLIPFLPVRAGGRLTISRTQVDFAPVLHWGLVTRRLTIPLGDIVGVELSGAGMEFNWRDFISIGRRIIITLRDGRRLTFRGLQVEELYIALQQALGQHPNPGSP